MPTKPIKVTNKTIKDVIKSLIKEYGNNVDLNHLDVSRVTDMSWLFNNSKFNGDISNWDVKNVINMGSMFGWSKFNQDISNWDVSNARAINYMFYESKFNQDISNWDINNTDITGIFCYENWKTDIIKEFYNGIIPKKGKILDVLRLDHPEYFI
jgi:surface protein